jgi:acetylornithine/succinyldiaminopimelate/putrescine aminotransferase
MTDLFARHRAVIPSWAALYYEQPLEIVRGKGCRVTDAEGRSYLDFFGGILTNMLGYDVPEVREAVERQLTLSDDEAEEGLAILVGALRAVSAQATDSRADEATANAEEASR